MDAEIKGQIEDSFRVALLALSTDKGKDDFKREVSSLRSLINDLDDIELSMYAHKALEVLMDARNFFDRDW